MHRESRRRCVSSAYFSKECSFCPHFVARDSKFTQQLYSTSTPSRHCSLACPWVTAGTAVAACFSIVATNGKSHVLQIYVIALKQIQHMEREMLKHRREIETLVRTALQEQMREVELNQKLKDTLCYGCWVNLCLIITDEADKYQVESQKVRITHFQSNLMKSRHVARARKRS